MVVNPAWVSLVKVARAWVASRCDPKLTKRFEQAYTVRLRQTSPEAAVWGTLKDVGLRRESDHLRAWLVPPNPLPTRVVKGDVEVYLGRTDTGYTPPTTLGSPCPTCPGQGVAGYPCPLRR